MARQLIPPPDMRMRGAPPPATGHTSRSLTTDSQETGKIKSPSDDVMEM